MGTDARGFYTDADGDNGGDLAPAKELTPADAGLPDEPDADTGDSGDPDQAFAISDHPAAGVPMPSEVHPAFAAPAAPSTPGSSEGEKVKAGVETRGITEHGKKQAAGVFGEADRATAAYEEKDKARTDAELAKSQADYGQLEKATGAEAEIERKKGELDREVLARQEAFNQHAANTEAQIATEAKAERARYLTAYQTQLAGVRQLAAQSGNPINQLTTTQALGLAGAQFVQGFLAVRGMHIDVSGQVDRWVDRSIAEHQQAIENARGAAQDQLHLYEIARQSSQDDWEARQRYRGFVIQGLQTSLQMNAARFNSQIAAARAQEQVARLQIDADNTARTIGDAHEKRVTDFMKDQFDAAFKKGTLAIETYKANAEAELKRAQAKALENKAAPALTPVLDVQPIIGPNGQKTYRTIGYISSADKDATNKLKTVEEKRTYADNMFEALDRLEKSREKAMAELGKNGAISDATAGMESETYRQYLRDRTAAIMAIRQSTTGKAFTKEETKEYESLLPSEYLWQKGNNEAAVPQLREKIRSDFEGAARSYLTADDKGQSPGNVSVAPAAKQDYNAITTGAKPVADFAEQEVERAHGDSREAHGTASRAFINFVESRPGVESGEKYSGEGKRTQMLQPEPSIAIDHLAMAVVDPARIRKYGESQVEGIGGVSAMTDGAIAEEAKRTLDGIVDGSIEVAPVVKDYAAHLKKLLDRDPTALKEELEGR